jgi:integrase
MATIRKRTGKYQVQVRRLGHKPLFRSFTLKSDAIAWARRVETDIERGTCSESADLRRTTLGDVIARYRTDVLPRLAESARIGYLSRLRLLDSALGSLALSAITTEVVASYRNSRLKEVTPNTVIRDLGVLSQVLTACRTEWGLPVTNAVREIRKPSAPPGRTRRLQAGELERLHEHLSPRMRAVVTFAIETGMRRSEIVAMQWGDVDWERRTLRIPKTKTGVPRTIPLSRNGYAALQSLHEPGKTGRVLDVPVHAVSHVFIRVCKRAGITDLHFHDLRHEATSRLFEKGLNVMEVASITGHADVRMLARYTHLRADDLVCKVG